LYGLIQKFNLDADQIFTPQTWIVILVLSLLVVIILINLFIIFIYNQKILQLYRMQHNFINNFTHELKTPVTSLKLFLETFLKHDLDAEQQKKYLNFMIQDVDRLSGHIHRILSLAKIESKTYGGELVQTDLISRVERCIARNRHQFSNCRFQVSNPENREFCYLINPALFDMLVMNLLTNAVTYNEADIPQIDISFAVTPARLLIRFTDNGIGMDPSHYKKVFRKFYQIGRVGNRSAKGSGIGLNLVQSIARLHKGRVSVISHGPGCGSTFTLSLPRRLRKEDTRG